MSESKLVELHNMWKSQKKFNSNFVNFDNLNLEGRQEMTVEYVLHLYSEIEDLMKKVNWKIHHKKDIPINRNEIILELIDAWKYILSIGLLWDFTPEEFIEFYNSKSRLVEQKYLQEFYDRSCQEIIICDIDGVLSEYPRNFLEFVKRKVKKDNLEDLYDLDFDSINVTELNLYDYLNGYIDYSYLKHCKHLYRTMGESKKESVISSTIEFLKKAKSLGYYIVLLTSRPFDKYKNLELDTYEWLELNGIPFDMLINDSKKRDKVSELSKTSKIKIILDDDTQIINNLKCLDNVDHIYLLNKPYNSEYECSGKVIRVNDASEIILEESDI